jgi:hypothetical protein
MVDTTETPVAGPEGHADASVGALPTDPTTETAEGDSEPEVFSKDYVSKLRDEAATYRVKAAKHDETKAQLFHERVKATGRLVNADELPYSEDLLNDADALSAAVDTLLASKPYLAARKPVPGTTVGQGVTGEPPKQKTNLIGALRSAHGLS